MDELIVQADFGKSSVSTSILESSIRMAYVVFVPTVDSQVVSRYPFSLGGYVLAPFLDELCFCIPVSLWGYLLSRSS